MGKVIYLSYYDLLFEAIVEAKAPKVGYSEAKKWARRRLRELRVAKGTGRGA